MLQRINLSMNRRDPFYHQVHEVVTTEDADFCLSLEKQPQIQEAIVKDHFYNLVDGYESEDQGIDVLDFDSSPFDLLKEPLTPRSEVMSLFDTLENIACYCQVYD